MLAVCTLAERNGTYRRSIDKRKSQSQVAKVSRQKRRSQNCVCSSSERRAYGRHTHALTWCREVIGIPICFGSVCGKRAVSWAVLRTSSDLVSFLDGSVQSLSFVWQSTSSCRISSCAKLRIFRQVWSNELAKSWRRFIAASSSAPAGFRR